MVTFFIIVHLLVSAALVISILLQSGKGGGLSGAFGGLGEAGAILGGRGTATFLNKATVVLAIVFALNCFVLGYFYSQGSQVQTVTERVQGGGGRFFPPAALPDVTEGQEPGSPAQTGGAVESEIPQTSETE